jgi:pSer/pThr/pTyr-binding forkhead associated (FHA) protein
MYARLFAKTGTLAGKSYEIAMEAVVGHGPECNLKIKSGVLSAKHARIFFDQKKGSYFLEDFKSLNGTLLDGKPVQGRVKLERKHVVTFANTFTFIFQVETGQPANPLPPPPKDLPPEPEIPPPPRRRVQEAGERPPTHPPGDIIAPEPARPPSPRAVPDVPPAMPPPRPEQTYFDDEGVAEPPVPEAAKPEEEKTPPVPQSKDAAPTMLIDDAQLAALLNLPRFVLEFRTVRGEKHTVDLNEGENSVGRIAGSTIALDDASISRNHAAIIIRSGRIILKDLGSKNGTFVGDKKIGDEVEVKPETPLRFGLVKATILKKAETPA